MVSLRTLIGFAAVALGASALVVDPMHYVQRSGELTAHRRHAANVLNVRQTSPAPPKRTIAERRSLRQKRCAQRTPNTGSSVPAATSSAVETVQNVPQNVGADPTPQAAATTTPAADPEPTPDNSGNSGNSNSGSSTSTGSGATNTGDLTFYDVGLGACGGTNTDSDMICAASMLLYDGFDGYTGANPNANPICGKQIAITYGGKTITVTVVDRCVGCAEYDLDLSPTAFSQLADQSQGRLHGATWQFV